MAKKKSSSAAGAAVVPDKSDGLDPDSGLNPDGMVGDGEPLGEPLDYPGDEPVDSNAPVDTPPPSSEEKDEEKKTYQRQANRPECHACGQLMHAKSTQSISTWYYCENEDCSNRTGRQVYRKEAREFLDRNRDVGQQSVAARANMKDTSGE